MIKDLLEDNDAAFPEFLVLIQDIDLIISNFKSKPDLSISICKALIESVCKTILSRHKIAFTEKGRNPDHARDLFKKVAEDVFPDSLNFDVRFSSNILEAILRMVELRNERCDVSHGKILPKELESDEELAKFIWTFTEALLEYLLSIYFKADLSYLDEIKYEDNPEFNEFLDEQHDELDVCYSRALFNQDEIRYKTELQDYLSE